jgi:ATP-dependent exoDNAse (exonuclease V) beta subunit
MNEKNFVVYKSSAGSGKTYSLVREYLKLVLCDTDNYKRTLAITFTNKAAKEMKTRVMSSLRSFTSPNITDDKKAMRLLQEISSETKVSVENLIKNSFVVQQKILHNYSDFHISTIDSFVQKIIRSFATDLRLSADYEISLDDKSLLYEAVDSVISLSNREEDITSALVKFIEFKTDDERSWDFDKELKQFASNLLNESFHENMQYLSNMSVKDFIVLISKLSDNIKQTEETVTNLVADSLRLIRSKGLVSKDFYHGDQGIPAYFKRFINNNFGFEAKTYVMNAIEEDIWYSKSASEQVKNNIEEIKDELRNNFVNIDDLKTEYRTFKVVRKNLYPLALLNEIEKAYNRIKSENNIVAISDFNKIISGIVSKEPVPFVYERIGEKYEHYLIDEFQDTSVLQWNNLLPLIHNALSKGEFNMIVGDAKQAIYRFRGGDVEQFVNLPAIARKIFRYDAADENALLTSLNDNFQEKFLNINYRSKAEIVNFNNDFFRHLAANIGSEGFGNTFNKIYDSVFQNTQIGNEGGYVSLEFIEKEKDTIEDVNLLRIKEIIEDLSLSGYELRDIAVLCRKNKNANEVARFLIANGINVVSSESLLLSGSDDVKFLTDITVFLMNPVNMVARSSIIEYLINTGRIGHDFDFCTKMVSADDHNVFTKFIEQGGKPFLADELAKLPYYELIEELLMYFGMDRPDPYIQHFLDCALEFTTGTNRGFNDFLNWWEENKNKRSVIMPDGLNAVRIMTIHKSKGLEFPVVIFPYANETVDLKRSYDFIEFKSEKFPELKKILVKLNKSELDGTDFSQKYYEEEQKYLLDMLNTLYVTMTRPTDRLYILTELFNTEKVASLDNLPKFFWHYLTSNGLWEEKKSTYEFGVRADCVKIFKDISANEPENIFLDRMVSNDWKKNISIRYKAPEFWDSDDPEKNKNWGKLIHYVLAEISDRKDVENVLDRLLSEGVINDDNVSQIREKSLAVVNHEELSGFFNAESKILNESEIIDRNGDTHRPDRMILDGKKAVIIDYKTGAEMEYHKGQINGYAELLAELGYVEFVKYLVYINENIKVIKF